MILGNQKPIVIVGYEQASMTLEFANEIGKTHDFKIIPAEQFLELKNLNQNQYIVAVCKPNDRMSLLKLIDDQNLDLISVIHESVVQGVAPPPSIGPGTFIFPFCSIFLNAKIGRHCIIGAHSHIGHFCSLGDNCQIRPGVMINGKSSVGNNCMINTRVTVTNKSKVADNIELLAFTNVVKNLTEPGIYAGSPAKKFKGLVSPNNG